MKIRLLIILFQILYLTSYSQTGTIYGQVFQRDGETELPDVVITIIDTDINTITDAKGKFLIKEIPIGTYSIKISCFGCNDLFARGLNVANDTVINIIISHPDVCDYMQSKNYNICPVCHKNDEVIPIVYGLIIGIKLEDVDVKFRLGGCILESCQPYWYCKRDKKEF